LECSTRFDRMTTDDRTLQCRSSARPVTQSTESSCSERLRQCVEYLTQRKELAVQIEDFLEAHRCKEVLNDLDNKATTLRKLEERKRVAVNGEDYDAAKALKAEVQRLRVVVDKVVAANLALPKIEVPMYARAAKLRALSQSQLQTGTQVQPLRHSESQYYGGGRQRPQVADDEVLVTSSAVRQHIARRGNPQRGSFVRVAAGTQSPVLNRGNGCGRTPTLLQQNLGPPRRKEQNENRNDEHDGLPWWQDTDTTISCREKGNCISKSDVISCRLA